MSRQRGMGRRWPVMFTSRRPRAVGVFALLTTLAVTAAACGSGSSEGALQGKSATAITSISVKAYHRQESVRFVTKTVAGTTTTVETGATSRSGSATETVETNGQPVVQALVVDHVAYIRAIASILEGALDLPTSTATEYAGKWISLVKGDSEFDRVANTLGPTDAILQFVPEEPNLRVAGATLIAGKEAVAIAGSPAGSVSPGSVATSTLFVSTTAPFLPLSSTLVVTSTAGKDIERVAAVFSKWNKPVDPVPPTGAIPVSSLGG